MLKKIKIFISNYQISKDYNLSSLKKFKIFISNYQISKNYNLSSLKKLKSLFLTTKFLKFLTLLITGYLVTTQSRGGQNVPPPYFISVLQYSIMFTFFKLDKL